MVPQSQFKLMDILQEMVLAADFPEKAVLPSAGIAEVADIQAYLLYWAGLGIFFHYPLDAVYDRLYIHSRFFESDSPLPLLRVPGARPDGKAADTQPHLAYPAKNPAEQLIQCHQYKFQGNCYRC